MSDIAIDKILFSHGKPLFPAVHGYLMNCDGNEIAARIKALRGDMG